MLDSFTTLFNFRGALDYLPQLLQGAVVSVEMTVWVMALSLVFGLVVALARLTRMRAVRIAATFYVEVVRGTPAILQLFYIYFVLPAFGINIPPFGAGVVGLTVNYAAYLSEVYRAGIESVHASQTAAGSSPRPSGSWYRPWATTSSRCSRTPPSPPPSP